MKIKSFYFLSLLAGFFLLSSCSDLKQQKELYGDWWPVHASGSLDNEQFTARWDSDLGVHGDIVITFTDKKNPKLTYEDTQYYPMLSFSKKQKKYCTVSLQSLGDMKASRYRSFEIKDGKISLEKAGSNGRGNGEFTEPMDLTFLEDDVVRIGDVTYERYAYFKNKHPEIFKPLAEKGFDLETPPIIFPAD